MIQSPYNIIHVFHIMCFKSKTHKIEYLNNQIDQAQGNIIAYIGLVENIISDYCTAKRFLLMRRPKYS